MNPVEVRRGDTPIVLAVPHAGTWLPDDARAPLNETGLALADTDWHVDRLYADLLPDATVVRATFHRYVIDANRDPSGQSLYPGQNTTGLCPTTDFDNRPLYRDGAEPDAAEIARRLAGFHRPYHRALAGELERLRARHGIVILYDCHSIRSRVPFLFAGTLPDFNIGTNDGMSCAPRIESAVRAVCESAQGYTTIVNGRFRGGWTVRHYGRPDAAMHAVQMELAQSTYMSEAPPWMYRDERAERLRRTLRRILDRLAEQVRHLGTEKQANP